MNQKSILFIIAMSIAIIGNAQITEVEGTLKKQNNDTLEGWKKGGVVSANLAQTNLTNWAAGGENSLTVNSLFSVFANYKKGKVAWDNSLDVGYGVLGSGADSLEFKKTDDKIDFLSKYGYKARKNFYYAGLFNFKTQMANGYDYTSKSSLPISTYLAPGYITLALGMDYKPNSYVSVFVAPATLRTTLVTLERLANAGDFGVEGATYDDSGILIEKGKKYRNEMGGYIRIIYSRNDFTQEILKNVSITSKLDLFSNYLDSPENIDVNWENQIAFTINKYFSVTFNTHLIYDDDIKFGIDTNNDGEFDKFSPRVQFKQILGLAFTYKF